MEIQIITIILSVFGLSYDAVFSECRKRELVICRQAIHYFIHRNLKYYLHETGNLTGHSHCTVLHSEKKIDEILETHYNPYASFIKEIGKRCEEFGLILESRENKHPKIEVQNYIFYEHSNLLI